MSTRVIHFGAGALGRGLVIPALVDSGCEVIIVDTDDNLIGKLNHSKQYILEQTDSQARYKAIHISEAISPIKNHEKLVRYLSDAKIVTTSVRRENLIHVARTLASTWGEAEDNNRMVFCCENIEKVGSYFSSLLDSAALTSDAKKRLAKILIPDTLVDRICASASQDTSIISESFFEISVDGKVLNDTGIRLIPSVLNLEKDFVRKRFLLNTYADAISFLAKDKGMTFLYEAANDEEIHRRISPYLELLWKLLEINYKLEREELEKWSVKYRSRLKNKEIPRKLETVARNFWAKLTLNERFVWPLIQLMKQGIEIEKGVEFLSALILIGSAQDGNQISNKEIMEKLKSLWCSDDNGKQLYLKISSYFG